MKRALGWVLGLAAVGGCVPTGSDYMSGMGRPGYGPMAHGGMRAPTLPGAVGPWGEPVAMMPPVGPHARGFGGIGPELMPPHLMAAGGPAAVAMLPPNHLAGDPGIIQASHHEASKYGPPGIVHSQAPIGPAAPAFPLQRTQVRFAGPAGGKIGWYVATGVADAAGKPIGFAHQLDLPGRYNFLQASIYRVKLSDIPGRAGLELYPTIEVVPSNPKTEAFLAHNYVPVEFTEQDFDQIAAGNYLTKVVYLPDEEHQSPLAAGPAELVSTLLPPGVDPVAEAHRRGHILLVVRVGGIDLETANSPPLDGSGPYGAPKVPALVPVPPAALPPAAIDPKLIPEASKGTPAGLPPMPILPKAPAGAIGAGPSDPGIKPVSLPTEARAPKKGQNGTVPMTAIPKKKGLLGGLFSKD